MNCTGPHLPPELIAGLRDLLNQWDPIAVLDAVPDPPSDEYDRLVGPLATRLAGPGAAREIVAYLTAQMRDAFGLDPGLVGVEPFVERLIRWYSDVWVDAGGPAAR